MQRIRQTFGAAAIGIVLALGVASPAFAEAGVTVTPSTGLTDGQTVAVKATGFTPGSTIFVLECDLINRLCDEENSWELRVAADGTASAALRVHAAFTGVDPTTGASGTVNCANTQCGVAASTADQSTLAVTQISFK